MWGYTDNSSGPSKQRLLDTKQFCCSSCTFSPSLKKIEALPKGKAPIKRFLSIHRIYSACGSRSTHGLAPQSADTEPVHCFIATDSWSTPLSSSFIIYTKRCKCKRIKCKSTQSYYMLKGFGHCYVCECHAPLLPSTASPWRTNTETPRHSGRNWIGCAIQQALGVCPDGAERGDGALPITRVWPRKA